MTCKDCIHFEVCGSLGMEVYYWGRKPTLQIFLDKYKAEYCTRFKTQSRFVELPCKVGDTVYVIESIDGEEKIIQDHVETISIGYYADGVNIYQFDGVKTDGYFEDFGKTVFLTREEAEQALKLKTGDTNA